MKLLTTLILTLSLVIVKAQTPNDTLTQYTKSDTLIFKAGVAGKSGVVVGLLASGCLVTGLVIGGQDAVILTTLGGALALVSQICYLTAWNRLQNTSRIQKLPEYENSTE